MLATFTLDKKRFSRVLLRLSKTVNAKSIKYILRTVKLKFQGRTLTFYGTDLDTYHRESIVIENPPDFDEEVCVDLKALRGAVQSSSANTIDVTITTDKMIVGGHTIPIDQYPEEFPAPPFRTVVTSYSLPASQFHTMLERTVVSCYDGDSKYAIQGVLFEMSLEELGLVATDGIRMSTAVHGQRRSGVYTSAILPSKVAKNIVHAVKKADECELTISQDPKGQYVITAIIENDMDNGKTSYVCRTIEREFVDWRAVIPNNLFFSGHVESSDLASVVKSLLPIVEDEGSYMMRFLVSEENARMSVVARSGERIGSGAIPLYAENDAVVNLNAKLFMTFLKVCKGRLSIFQAKENGMIVLEIGDTTYYQMPMGAE